MNFLLLYTMSSSFAQPSQPDLNGPNFFLHNSSFSSFSPSRHPLPPVSIQLGIFPLNATPLLLLLLRLIPFPASSFSSPSSQFNLHHSQFASTLPPPLLLPLTAHHNVRETGLHVQQCVVKRVSTGDDTIPTPTAATATRHQGGEGGRRRGAQPGDI